MSQGDRTNLGEESGNQPVSDSSGKCVAAGTDLHGHYFGHINPRDGTEGEGEDDRDEEEEGYA